MTANMAMVTRCAGDSTAKLKRGGMKKNHTKRTLTAVLTMPPRKPVHRALKKTAGKKKNQTKGWIHGQSAHCAASATMGSSNARP